MNMKKMKSIKEGLVTVMVTVAIAIMFLTSCTKDGTMGPAGVNGTDGTDGIDGTDGTDGTDANAISPADSAAYDAADGLIGGRLYDNFMGQLSITDTSMTNHSNFFRCKQCHGWDLRGSLGAYINRAPNASRPEVAPNDLYVFAQAHNIRELFDAVKHSGGRYKSTYTSLSASMPDYGLILTDGEIWQITKFLKNEAFNTFNLYNINTTGSYPTGTKTFSNIGKDGDASNGNTLFASNCASCHGADGTLIAIEGDAYIGDYMRNKAYETQHKMRSGQPNTEMGPFPNIFESDVKDMLKAGQDPVAFPGF